MARETKAQKAEREEAIETIRGMVQPGDTVYTILRHCSASGMLREISLHVVEKKTGRLFDLTYFAARAMGDRMGKRGGIRVPGCGMDMGFHIVYCLSSVCFRNQDQDAGSRGPGYALRQEWI